MYPALSWFPVLTGSRPDYIGYQSALRVQNKRLKKLGKLVGADLSTYIARHTWASVAAQKGIPEELISQGMGHESVKNDPYLYGAPGYLAGGSCQ